MLHFELLSNPQLTELHKACGISMMYPSHLDVPITIDHCQQEQRLQHVHLPLRHCHTAIALLVNSNAPTRVDVSLEVNFATLSPIVKIIRMKLIVVSVILNSPGAAGAMRAKGGNLGGVYLILR